MSGGGGEVGDDRDLLHELAMCRRALKRAQGWLRLLAQERPETSDIHSVLAAVEACIPAPATAATPAPTPPNPKD